MNYVRFSVASAALLLAACGGSGPADDSSTGNTGGSAFALNSGNAQPAAAASYKAASGSAEFSDVGGSIGASANQPGMTSYGATGDKGSKIQLAGFLVNVVQNIPFGPQVLPCAVSGSLTIAGDIADPFTLTAGDTFAIDADACDDGLGEVLDGSMDMSVSEFSGDLFLGTYLIGLDADLDALQVTTASDVISNTGDTSVLLDTRAAPFVTATVDGVSMTTTSNSSTETLTNYSTMQTVDAGQIPSPYTLDSSGTLDSSQLSGEVSYSTPVPFAGFDVDYPGSGELLVSAANSSVRLVALDNVNVRLDIDTDGDGTVDEVINITWQELTE